MVSALSEDGLEAAWDEITALTEWRRDAGVHDAMRSAQAQYWFEEDVRSAFLSALERPEARSAMQQLGAQVSGGTLEPGAAAKEMLRLFGPQCQDVAD